MQSRPSILSEGSLTGLLLPFWQIVIGCLVLFVIGASVRRLARRGQSRMSTALLVTAGVIVGIAALGIMLQST